MYSPRSSSWFRAAGLVLAGYLVAAAPLQAQVRKLHTRDFTRLSQVQVTEQLKQSDVIFIPIGSVETNGTQPSDRDWVAGLGFAIAMADEVGGLYMPGLMWSYPGTTLIATATINISPTQGIDFLKATCESLIRAGFRRIVFVSSGHGPAPMTAGVVLRELFDKFRTPLLYLEMGEQMARLKIAGDARNKLLYGSHHLAGRMIDLALKGEYGDGPTDAIPVNPGMEELGKLGVTGSLAVGSWITDYRGHGPRSQVLPATDAEREKWGQEGEAQIRDVVKKLNIKAVVEAQKKHDEFTNKVLVPKYQSILPPQP